MGAVYAAVVNSGYRTAQGTIELLSSAGVRAAYKPRLHLRVS